jgi:hypothetical protein
MAFKLSRPLLAVTAFFALANIGAGCEGDDLVKDPTFRTWCGDELCAWTTEVGAVQRAPTWHRNDYGVELAATPTTIAQETDTSDARCLVFTTVADVEASAQVALNVDFDRDGVVDFDLPIAETGFRQVRAELTPPTAYDGIRFAVTKKGEGRAVLAQVRVERSALCSAPPIVVAPRPLGGACSAQDPGACASGVCCNHVCAECCDPDALGLSSDGRFFPDEAPIAPPVACPGAARCGVRAEALAGVDPSVTLLFTPLPMQCDPGQRLRPSGAACLADDDCASGACDGASAEAEADTGASCEAHYPSSGAQECHFRRVRGGLCR